MSRLNITLTRELEVDIMEDKIYKLILKFLKLNQPKVPRHSIVMDLLDVLESSGECVSLELIKAVSDGTEGDEKSKKIIKKILGNGYRKK